VSKDDVDIRVRLREARKAQQDADRVRKGLLGVGAASKHAGLMSSASSRGFRLGAAGLLGVGSAAGVAVGALGGLTYMLGKKSLDAFTESEKVAKDQAAALKSTGAQAWVTEGHLDAMAQAQRRRTGIDDEAIKKAQTVLLTFRQIHNELGKGNAIFDQASQVTLDLSKRFGKDLSSSSILVGKALNDPIKGLTALQRVGITFTAQQKDQIKTLVASGNTLGAQKVILKELTAQTKGSAAAQATNADRLRSSWDNVKEAIGSGLYPTVTKVEGALFHLSEHAQPYVAKAAKDMSRELGKGLTVDHLGNALRIGHGDLRPLERDLRRELATLHIGSTVKSWHIDKRLEDAFVAASPRIVDAMAAAAPRAATAFIHAFANAGPGGQLLTVALLLGKMRAFSAVAPLLGRRFGRGIAGSAVPVISGQMAPGGPGGSRVVTAMGGLGQAAGAAFGAYAALTIAHSMFQGVPDPNRYIKPDGTFDWNYAITSATKFLNPEAMAQSILDGETKANPVLTYGDASGLAGRTKRKSTPSHSTAGSSPAHTARSRGKIAITFDVPAVFNVDGSKLAESNAKARLVHKNRGGG